MLMSIGWELRSGSWPFLLARKNDKAGSEIVARSVTAKFGFDDAKVLPNRLSLHESTDGGDDKIS